MNYFRTAILLSAMTALFLAVGFMLGGQSGMMLALGMAAVMNIISYWNADKIVLRMYGATEVDETSAPELLGIVRQLAGNAGLPMPRVYVIENDQPNAFATGRNPQNAAVAATTGLLRMLSSEEITGVMAHELAHVRNRDTLIMTITATIAGAISMLANFAMFFGRGSDRNNPLGIVGVMAMAILAPLAAALVQMAISRGREYTADRHGAEICGRPLWLASALEKMAQAVPLIDNQTAERNPATSHLFIVNPLHVHRIDGLFSTHPNVADRIARLRAMPGVHAGVQSVPHTRAAGPWG